MKKIILLLSAVLLWALPVSVSAQNKNNDKAKQQRKEQFDRFCKFRRDFMMKQIGLSEQEAKQFFPLYEEMEGKHVSVAGRVMQKRVMGKASFCNILDLSGNIQSYVARDSICLLYTSPSPRDS